MPLIDPVTMSSSIVKGSKSPTAVTTTSTKAAEPTQLHPVHTNPTSVSQAARHIFPAALLAVFAASFNHLVADPVSTLATYLPVCAVLQLCYALICLPVAGSPSGKARKHRPREKRKAGEAAGPNVIIAAVLSLVLTTLAVPVLYSAMILFGAPVLTHLPHTLLCAAHLATLTVFPLVYVHGVDSSAWAAVAGLRAPFDETFGGLVGGFLGAWLGAVPIPLDWDREWQKWPVTILCGIYAGYLAGRVIGGTIAFGKKF
ncbi:Glycosylphosphatidylinositol anchor biosynthesis protein 11 [Pleurostoma richardsiae]|uniref:Glycosylphosphatidylinositol anchor biosynthesis protein 11 n=1 Tax=Pleurostoma richardsiae TaxID=41990 RepID=A0AA38SBQ7_9PEZI|nr:Glycosylphosphatidylinositol anchor biosynthesis protein 11 [Pleurostoma richardsiae]